MNYGNTEINIDIQNMNFGNTEINIDIHFNFGFQKWLRIIWKERSIRKCHYLQNSW